MLNSSTVAMFAVGFIEVVLGVKKLQKDPEQYILYMTQLRYPLWFMYMMGAIEVGAALTTAVCYDIIGATALVIPLAGMLYSHSVLHKDRQAIIISVILFSFAVGAHLATGLDVMPFWLAALGGFALHFAVSLRFSKRTKTG